MLRLVIWLCSLSAAAFAGTESFLPKQEQLVSIAWSVGEPLRIFIVGREEAKIDLKELDVTVRRLKPYPGRTQKAKLDGSSFIVKNSPELEKATDIEVVTKMKNESRTQQFNLKMERH